MSRASVENSASRSKAICYREIGLGISAYSVLLAIGYLLDPFNRLTTVQYLIPVSLAVGLSFMWGQAGILSFGQSLFYGLGGYTYGIVAINLMDDTGLTNIAFVAAFILPLTTALLVGWFLFYSKLSEVYVAIIMFILTIMMYSFMAQTAGPQWHIGSAFLGGTNGLGSSGGEVTPPPPLGFGFNRYNILFSNDSFSFFCLVAAISVFSITIARLIIQSRWGLILRAIRENPTRAGAMGYDERIVRLTAFVMGAAYATISGILYVSWSNFITPDVFSVAAAVLPVLWVTIGGVESVIGSAVAAAGLSWLTLWLATRGNLSDVVVGGLLILVAAIIPKGVGPVITQLFRKKEELNNSDSIGFSDLLRDINLQDPIKIQRSDNESTVRSAAQGPILQIDGINKRWRGVVAVSNVSIKINKGGIVCVIGPNGAGKSTLLKCITGDNKVDSGRIIFNGTDITNQAKYQRARQGITIKYQNGGTYEGISMAGNLQLALMSPARQRSTRGRKEASAFPSTANSIINKAIHGSAKVEALSHGVKQILDIIMAFECNPDLVILDEPVAGLSVGESMEVAKLIKHLSVEREVAVLITEHDMSFIRMMDAEVIVLNRGEILATGSYEEMMNDPRVRNIYLGE